METGSLQTLSRYCSDGVCHCDWRLAIRNCEEATAMWYINLMVIIISGISILAGTPLIFYRLAIQGHSLWNHKMAKAVFLRPKPVDCMLIMHWVYNALRLFDAVILITDQFPTNLAARGFLFEVAYAFALGGMTLYLIGIAQTISQSHQSVSDWLPSPLVVDVLGAIALFCPFFGALPLTIAGGARSNKNLGEAEALIITAHVTWLACLLFIGSGTLLSAIRLVHILKKHHQKTRQSRSNGDVKAGILKIQLIAATFVISLCVYSIIVLAFIVRRRHIIDNTVGNIMISIPWALLAGLTTIAAQASVILSPKMMRNAALKPGQSGIISTETKSSTRPDQQFGSTMDPMTTVFHDESHSEAIISVITKDRRMKYHEVPQTGSGNSFYITKGAEGSNSN